VRDQRPGDVRDQRPGDVRDQRPGDVRDQRPGDVSPGSTMVMPRGAQRPETPA